MRREGSPEGVPTGAAALWSRKKSIEVVRASDQDASRKACQGAVIVVLVCQSLLQSAAESLEFTIVWRN